MVSRVGLAFIAAGISFMVAAKAISVDIDYLSELETTSLFLNTIKNTSKERRSPNLFLEAKDLYKNELPSEYRKRFRPSRYLDAVWKYFIDNKLAFLAAGHQEAPARHAIFYQWKPIEGEFFKGGPNIRIYYPDVKLGNFSIRKEIDFFFAPQSQSQIPRIREITINGIPMPALCSLPQEPYDCPSNLLSAMGFSCSGSEFGYIAPGNEIFEVDAGDTYGKIKLFYDCLTKSREKPAPDILSDTDKFFELLPEKYRSNKSKLESVWAYLRDNSHLFLMPGMNSKDMLRTCEYSIFYYNTSNSKPIFEAERSICLCRKFPVYPYVNAQKSVEFFITSNLEGSKIQLCNTRISGILISPSANNDSPPNLYQFLNIIPQEGAYAGLYRSQPIRSRTPSKRPNTQFMPPLKER